MTDKPRSRREAAAPKARVEVEQVVIELPAGGETTVDATAAGDQALAEALGEDAVAGARGDGDEADEVSDVGHQEPAGATAETSAAMPDWQPWADAEVASVAEAAAASLELASAEAASPEEASPETPVWRALDEPPAEKAVQAPPDAPVWRPLTDVADLEDVIVDGDAATHLEALVRDTVAPAPPTAGEEGLPIELVGQHLRLSGTVLIGFHRRLSDFVNHNEGLIQLRDVTVLRRNGEPTKVTSPSIWVSPDEVTLIGQAADVDQPTEADQIERLGRDFLKKRTYLLIVVTPGHTLTGEVHLNLEGVLSAFIESPSPIWIPMTDVRTRSLADRRVISRYSFALVNRRHIVAATEMQPSMVRGRGVL